MVKYILSLFIGLTTLGCFPTQKATMEEDIVALENTKWELVKPSHLKGTIQFNEDATMVSGFNGCNTYSADVRLKNYQLEFGAFMQTEMYCEDAAEQEDEFMKTLALVQDYALTNKSLTLKRYGATILTFKEVEE